MSNKNDFQFSKYDLNFLIQLKAHQFRKQEIDNIKDKEIRNYLFDVKWKRKQSIPMCDLVDDIMDLQFSDVFDYLGVKAVKEANTLDLSSFQDFILK